MNGLPENPKLEFVQDVKVLTGIEKEKHNMKICSKCKQIKSLNEFYNDHTRKSGKGERCKECIQKYYIENSEYIKTSKQKYYLINIKKIKQQRDIYRINNCDEINERARKIRIKNYTDWNNYFRQKYGDNPKCQICNKRLEWKSSYERIKNTVCFDHKYNGIIIKQNPSNWYISHKLIKTNIDIWESCNFGILCIRCNSFFPINNRKEFLQKITNYINN